MFLISLIIERYAAEAEMRHWINIFIEEIEKIDNFFNSKFTEYCTESEILIDTFIRKKHGNRYRN